jgi:hypothetical protein
MIPGTSSLKGGGASIAAKSSTLWCLLTGLLPRPNPIEGKRGIAVRGNELCLGRLSVVQRPEARVQHDLGS